MGGFQSLQYYTRMGSGDTAFWGYIGSQDGSLKFGFGINVFMKCFSNAHILITIS